MTTNLTWAISDLEREVSDGYVFSVHWRVFGSASDGSRTVSDSVCGEITLERPSEGEFIDYENLSEDVVISWVKTGLGQQVVKDYEDSLVGKLKKALEPRTELGLPWEANLV